MLKWLLIGFNRYSFTLALTADSLFSKELEEDNINTSVSNNFNLAANIKICSAVLVELSVSINTELNVCTSYLFKLFD